MLQPNARTLPEVSSRLEVLDTTLRDGISDRSIPRGTRLELLELIESTNVDAIEVGVVMTTGKTDDPIREACTVVRGTTAVCLAYPSMDAIERAVTELYAAERPRLHVFNPVGGAEVDVDEIHETVTTARQACAEVEWSALDATRADRELLCRAVEAAAKAGARIINVPDTRGRALPHEMSELIVELRNRVVELDRVVLSVHCHDDLGMATANTLEAVRAGARQIEGTLGGLGPQGGNASLEEVLSALEARSDRLGVGTSVDLARVREISPLVQERLV